MLRLFVPDVFATSAHYTYPQSRKTGLAKTDTKQKESNREGKNKKKGGMQQQHLQTKRKNKKQKQKISIIKTTLIIHLSSHNHHPNQENQTNDPESKSRIPLRTDAVLFQPGQCIDGDAADVVVVDVAVAVGVYVALFC
jgi:hypothetical protein